MEIFQIYVTVWGIACMTVGVQIGKYLLWIPGQPAGIIEIAEIKRWVSLQKKGIVALIIFDWMFTWGCLRRWASVCIL